MKNLIQTVTPKKAREWLKRNVNNRPLSDNTVQQYMDAMMNGRWKLNGEAIKFNCNGDLIDGQHRLHACDRSNAPFETYVLVGLPIDAFDSIDGGKLRSNGDRLARRGEKHYSTLAAAARNVWSIENNFALSHKQKFLVHMMDETLKRHDTIRDSVAFARQLRGNKAKGTGMIDPGILSAMVHLTRQSDYVKADQFWTRVCGGEGLVKTMPEYWLRQRLLDNLSASSKLPRHVVVALCIKAWNHAKAGKDCKNLRFDFEREDYPTID